MIRKESDGYHIYSHDGKKHLGGPYSKTKAEDRLKQIEMFKHIKENIMGSNINKVLSILEGSQTITNESETKKYKFLNWYECPCGHEWNDKSDHTQNDKCSECGKEIQPTDSEDLNEPTKPTKPTKPNLGKCSECGKPLSKGIKKQWDGYKKCDNMNCKKYNVAIPLK